MFSCCAISKNWIEKCKDSERNSPYERKFKELLSSAKMIIGLSPANKQTYLTCQLPNRHAVFHVRSLALPPRVARSKNIHQGDLSMAALDINDRIESSSHFLEHVICQSRVTRRWNLQIHLPRLSLALGDAERWLRNACKPRIPANPFVNIFLPGDGEEKTHGLGHHYYYSDIVPPLFRLCRARFSVGAGCSPTSDVLFMRNSIQFRGPKHLTNLICTTMWRCIYLAYVWGTTKNTN